MSALNSISPKAEIGENVSVGPFTFIDEDVRIGAGCEIGPNVTIYRGSRLGENCRVFPGAVIGAIPQDLKFEGEYTTVEIGDRVTVRECATVNRGTQYSNTTRVGSDTLLMAYVHVAHDCIIGNHCILANTTNLAGHVIIEDHVIFGGMAAAHQFVRIGKHAFIAGGTLLRKDVPPYVIAAKDPTVYSGVNSVGLKRRGFSDDEIHHIQDVYRYLYNNGMNRSEAIGVIKEEVPITPIREDILHFILQSERGIIRGIQQ
jgi:UDP-N-acetylglucosamine acyltransferase